MTIEGANGTAVRNDRRPVGVGLGRGKAAVGEVGQGCLEPDATSGLAAAVVPVAGGTGPLVQLGAASRLRDGSERREGEKGRGN